MPKNMFADVDDTRQLIYQLVGLSSVCWVDKPAGVYDSMLACKAAEDALTRLNELKRDEMVDFAVWLLQDEPGAGREEKLVDTYLAGLGTQFRVKVTNLILNGEHCEEVDR